ncbi:HesA/MoeB/ThiF family protein [Bradyrhizobium mercantei]|uniref:HesA/MoeB/ThiF family protein n=1 Tax=Bradyrhizobium mercantei TaxID=1904807 RepID=UPI000978944A|nr:ThiF family adenylyltransferase [Bradyrhizobium mercantei]
MTRHNKRGADQAWWTIWPEIFDVELAAFARLGITPRIVHKGNGVLILEADWPVQGQSAHMLLRIGYSPLHPFCRPAIAAPNESFERHQNPFSRELCLLTQELGQWDSRQLVADFIQERLDQLLHALTARRDGRWEDAAALEEQAADPLMPYFAGAAEVDSVILFDGQAPLPSGQHGLMQVACTNRATMRNGAAIEGVLQQLKTSAGVPISKHFGLPVGPEGTEVITGRWVKFTPPATADGRELLRLAEEELARQAVLQRASVQKVNDVARGPFSITGIVFPEESEYGSQKSGVGWLFLVTRGSWASGDTCATDTKLIRGERAGKDDIFSRLPVAKSLLDKKALVVGCGAIGSFAGLELARAGVGEIGLVDFDTVEPGNSLRWPLGRTVWGNGKASALANFIASNYPWTKAWVIEGKLGAAVTEPAHIPRQWNNILTPLFDEIHSADIVVDASASSEVHLALSHYCRRFRVPYVMGYATLGVAGGVVARFLPDSEGCFVCLQEHWNDARVSPSKDKQHIPEPRVDDAGVVTPVGCNAPTFTGGGFDLQEISLEIVRTTVGLLSEGNYDPGGWDLAVLTLKDDEGARMLPRWQAFQCPPHPRCCGTGR